MRVETREEGTVHLGLLPERQDMLTWLDELRVRIEAGTVHGLAFVALNADGSISNASTVQPGANEMTLLGGVKLLRMRVVAAILQDQG